jgi:hypothetical protein
MVRCTTSNGHSTTCPEAEDSVCPQDSFENFRC